MKKPNRLVMQGFSLFELIVVGLISAILIAMGIPSLSEMLVIDRPKRMLVSLDRALSYARLQAIYSGERITLCPLLENRCIRSEWHNELTIFIDKGQLRSFDKEDVKLRVIEHIPVLDELTYPRHAVIFKHTGSTWGLANGTFVYCTTHRDGSKSGKALSLSVTGRTTLKDTRLCN
ncbi:GspH/FimT family pseudopilin [Pseudoalteromonas luteoviolacea]|nr:GspH/FimT family pseudopilin [Pseudoalteromonas luteoviolacea]